MKNSILTLLIISIASLSYAQPPNIQWAKCYGGSHLEVAASVIQDKDGNFVFGGSSSSSDGDITDHHGGAKNIYNDFWIVKLNDTGKILWGKSYGGNYADACHKIIQTIDGGYISVGSTFSRDGDAYTNHDTTTAPHPGTTDVLVIKINKDGAVEWEKCYGGTNTEDGYDIQQTSDSGYVFVGFAGSTDGDVKGIHTTADLWVVKLDNTGKIMWQKCLGGSQTDEGHAIKQTQSNCYLVCGTTNSTDGDITSAFGSYDAWALKLDDTGKIMWQKTMGGSNPDHFSSLTLSPDGNYVFGGSTLSNDSTVSGNHLDTAGKPNADMWVVKTDTDGNMLWQRLYGGSGYEECDEIQVTNDSGFILNGWTQSTDGDVHFNYAADSGKVDDWWVLRLKPNGDTIWERTLGGIALDLGHSIVQTRDSFYIAAGETASRNGDVAGNKASLYTAWVVRLSDKELPNTAVPSYPSNTSISVYPNPFNNSFVLKYFISGNGDIEVTDIRGRIVYCTVLPKNTTQTTINATTWQPGIYFYKVLQNGNTLQTGKLLKQ